MFDLGAIFLCNSTKDDAGALEEGAKLLLVLLRFAIIFGVFPSYVFVYFEENWKFESPRQHCIKGLFFSPIFFEGKTKWTFGKKPS